MGELGGFLRIERSGVAYDDPTQRIEGDRTFKEFLVRRSDAELAAQGARCMECGVPFCHNGCPLGNLIPDWNDLVYRDKWHDAILQLHATNNFPEFTGRLCPAPITATDRPDSRSGGCGRIHPSSQARFTIASSICLIVTASPSRISSTQAASHGAGHSRPVNSGKLLVAWSWSIASRHRSR